MQGSNSVYPRIMAATDCEVLDASTTKMTDASSESDALRRELQPLIDEVKELLEPIEDAVDAAKEVVNSIPGLSW